MSTWTHDVRHASLADAALLRPLFLLLSAWAACAIPARRAAGLAPVTCPRSE